LFYGAQSHGDNKAKEKRGSSKQGKKEAKWRERRGEKQIT